MSEELPMLVPGVDITRMPLTAEEAMVITRIDGRTRVGELAKILGKPSAEVSHVVRRLVGLGAVSVVNVPAPGPPIRRSNGPSKPPTPVVAAAPRQDLSTSRPGIAEPFASSRPGIKEGSSLPPRAATPPPVRTAEPPKPSLAARPATPAPSPVPASTGSRSAPPAPRATPAPAPVAGPPSPAFPEGEGPQDYGDYVFTPAALSEDTDLDLELVKRVLFTEEHLTVWNHYEVLGLDRKAEAKAVKLAYFERSKEWHPDRFRRFKRPGSFGKRIEAVYKRVNLAYKVLADAEARKSYDETLPKPAEPVDIDALLQEQIQAERDRRRDEEARDRRLKKNPVLQRFAKAVEYQEQALAAEKAGKLAEAIRLAQLAVSYDERKPEYVALYDRLSETLNNQKADRALAAAKTYEGLDQFEDALRAYEHAMELTPKRSEILLRYAHLLLQLGRPADEILPFAHRAMVALPGEAESHYLVARCYEERGNEKGAQRHYERAGQLQPGYRDVESRLKKKKGWGFLGD